jgi:hypothetical protein
VSDPPPGAVLMTNSTGWVGCTAAGDALPDPLALADGALLLAQAESVTSAVTKIATVRTACLMTSHLH